MRAVPLANLRDAIALHPEGENLEALDLVEVTAARGYARTSPLVSFL